jgi:hypothetical protein
MVGDAPQSDQTRIAQQIPHWMFAMRDTLGANAYRALALAASGHRDNLPGVLHEAMRLWPTTPLLAREKVDDESQVMILNVFNHRDPREADFNRVRPDREGSYRFNHLSKRVTGLPRRPARDADRHSGAGADAFDVRPALHRPIAGSAARDARFLLDPLRRRMTAHARADPAEH